MRRPATAARCSPPPTGSTLSAPAPARRARRRSSWRAGTGTARRHSWRCTAQPAGRSCRGPPDSTSAWPPRISASSFGSCTPLNGDADRNRNPRPTPAAGSHAPAVCSAACHFLVSNCWISPARLYRWIEVLIPACFHSVCSASMKFWFTGEASVKKFTFSPPSLLHERLGLGQVVRRVARHVRVIEQAAGRGEALDHLELVAEQLLVDDRRVGGVVDREPRIDVVERRRRGVQLDVVRRRRRLLGRREVRLVRTHQRRGRHPVVGLRAARLQRLERGLVVGGGLEREVVEVRMPRSASSSGSSSARACC